MTGSFSGGFSSGFDIGSVGLGHRYVGTSLRRELEKERSAEGLLIFVEITHPELDDAIRVVTDVKDYSYTSQLWQGFTFDVELLRDSEGFPEARLKVQNVDQKIGHVLSKITEPPRVKLMVIPMSEFDLTVDPRTPISSPIVAYEADKLFLIDVDVDDLEVSGRLVSWNYAQETWPGIRATQNRCPGLFR